MRRAAIALLLVVLGWSAPAGAENARLENFLGPWIGQTFGDSPLERRGTLLVERAGPDGFAIEWTSFEAPEGKMRQRRLVFTAAQREGLWRSAGPNDPVANVAAWAYLAGRTLTINTIAVLDDGRLERQIYYRTLTRDGLTLAYRRYIDSEVERTLELKFYRLLKRLD